MQQSEGDPGLATEFGGEPASRVGYERERSRQQQNPLHPAPAEESLPPEQEQYSQTHDSDEKGSQSHHDVIAIIKEFNSIGPLIRRKSIEPLYLSSPLSICQETECIGDNDGIVESSGR